MLQVLLHFFVGQVRENGLLDKKLATGSNKLQNGNRSKALHTGILTHAASRHIMCMYDVNL